MKWLEPPQDAAEQALRGALDEATRRTGDEIARRRIWTRLASLGPEVPGTPRYRQWALRVALGAVVAGAAGGVLVWPRVHQGR